MEPLSINIAIDVVVLIVGAFCIRESIKTAIYYAKLKGGLSMALFRNFLSESWASFITVAFGAMALTGHLEHVHGVIQALMRLSMLSLILVTTKAARKVHPLDE